jgi:hypothetical protein
MAVFKTKAAKSGSRSNYKTSDVLDARSTWFKKKVQKGLDRGRLFTIFKSPKGERIMFVPGSRTRSDWVKNIREYTTGDHSDRQNVVHRLDKAARKYKVDKVYGHSRGAALVSDMSYNGRKIALDGAMSISKKGTTMPNYRNKDFFSKRLSKGYKYNYDIGSGSFHEGFRGGDKYGRVKMAGKRYGRRHWFRPTYKNAKRVWPFAQYLLENFAP